MTAAKKSTERPKRAYSRDFRPHGETGRKFTISRIPAGFWDRVKEKQKRTGVSLRSKILSHLQDWLEEEE